MEKQRTLDWFRKRLSCWNGSEVGKLMKTSNKKGEVFGDTAKTYIYKVAGERSLNPRVIEDDTMFEQYLDMVSFSNKFVEWGTEMEELAKKQFANKFLVSVEEVGSCKHESIPNFAASPDGIFYNDGKKYCLEIKCPKPEVFMKYKTCLCDWESLKDINEYYYWQCVAEIACTDSQGVYFCVFNPFINDPLFVCLLERNDELITALTERIKLAEEYISKIL